MVVILTPIVLMVVGILAVFIAAPVSRSVFFSQVSPSRWLADFEPVGVSRPSISWPCVSTVRAPENAMACRCFSGPHLGVDGDLFEFLPPKKKPRWWFQIFFIFTPTWGNDPI